LSLDARFRYRYIQAEEDINQHVLTITHRAGRDTISPTPLPKTTLTFPQQTWSSSQQTELLAAVIRHAPPLPTPAQQDAAYEVHIRTAIAELPAHLHAKYPKLSPYCVLNEKGDKKERRGGASGRFSAS
jgi:hypothetical protein